MGLNHMTEPATTAGTLLGVKYGAVLAGALGGILSLRYIENLTLWGRILAILAGATVAGYGTPVLDHWLDMGADAENALAFFLGLTAMNIIPGLIRLSEMFKSDPLGFIRRQPNARHTDHEH